ncbi:MAG: hypothetical protein HC842_10010, partial [Cytophagales bacterium]|nr:hypothetical protein [Cytophagales bacterium]
MDYRQLEEIIKAAEPINPVWSDDLQRWLLEQQSELAWRHELVEKLYDNQ